MAFMPTHFSEKFSADETWIGIGLMNSIKLDGNETILVLSTGLSFKADVSSLRSDERANVQNVSFESFYGGHQSFLRWLFLRLIFLFHPLITSNWNAIRINFNFHFFIQKIYDLFCLFLRRISAIWEFEDISLTHTQENWEIRLNHRDNLWLWRAFSFLIFSTMIPPVTNYCSPLGTWEINRTFHWLTGVITHFFRVLLTSRVGYYAGKLMEISVYFFTIF